MKLQQHPNVALLLATYNGCKYIDAQIRSLKENNTPFTLHWLDDHSTDNTRDVVRASALSAGIELREWHQTQHLGLPGTFFQLLECVQADIYLFCDQDDIWQPGKIDSTVEALLPDVASPVLCFSHPWVFNDNEPGIARPIGDFYVWIPAVLEESRMFMFVCGAGHTQGFTRPLREIFLGHKAIARAYAFMHDVWMYNIAAASGTIRMLSDVPTTLYRRHANNVTENLIGSGGSWIARQWRLHQYFRRTVARNAQGFVLASTTMPPGLKLDSLLEIARLMATLDRRQSPAALTRLARRRALHPKWQFSAWFVAVCLCSDAELLVASLSKA